MKFKRGLHPNSRNGFKKGHKLNIGGNETSFKEGKLHPFWKGKQANYLSFHTWLYKHFGKANICESSTCNNKSKIYD